MKPEDRFVEKLRALLPPDDSVLVGPGDDAAVVASDSGPVVATTDMLVESVDFLAGEDPEVIGRRAVAVNASDLAAMGAQPRWFLLAIGLHRPQEATALGIARGAIARAAEWNAQLVGGDLSGAPSTVVTVAMWGRLAGAPMRRSGASPGDLVYLSGFPGRAAAGLRLARRLSEFTGQGAAPLPRFGGLSVAHVEELLRAYRDPQPPVAVGTELARAGIATAAIDVSDGLGVDAGRLARASGVGLEIEARGLPVAAALHTFCELEDLRPVDLAVAGGDDYELLFCAPESAAPVIERIARQTRVSLARIGRVRAGSGVTLREGRREREIGDAGHDHFEAPR
ncbi:MAG: thiamine-phosphate kinase [Thermoanaerobaculia bacterium]